MSVSAAKSRVMQARGQLESNRLGEVEATIAQGEKFLVGLPDEETAAVRAELAAIREQLAMLPTPEETRNLSAAKGKIRQARSQIADRQIMGIEATVATAERHLLEVREIHRGEVGRDFEALKAEIAALQPDAPAARKVHVDDRASGAAPPPSPSTPAAATVPAASAPVASAPAAPAAAAANAPLSDDDHANLSRAKSRIGQARNSVESGRTEYVEAYLAEAAEFLDKVPAAATAALRAQMDELRAQSGAVVSAEANRRATSELDRHVRKAESDIETLTFGYAASALDHVSQRLSESDVTSALSSAELQMWRDRVVEVRGKLAAAIKATSLDRAQPLLEELEQMVTTDPFAGLGQGDAYKKVGELNHLRSRIMGDIQRVPEGDPDIAAVLRRVTAVDVAIDKASAAWGKAVLDAQVSNSWSVIQSDIAGWESESMSDNVAQLHEPELPLTRAAIQRIRYLLEHPETQKLRGEHRGDPAIEGPYQEAERVRDAAAAKLNDAYGRILDAGERLETPLNRFLLDRPALIAYGAESALAGTPHVESTVVRARKLDERWKAEVAAIMRARQELFDKLAAETETTWPGIRDATGAVPFDPETAVAGTVIRLDEIYNRSGWDYASRAFGFAANVNGTVIAGVYESHVLQALEHAWYELKLDVTDRFTWDIVGVVEGRDTIGVRTTVILRDASTNLEIGKLEQWPPTPCLRIRIIALHAGPVAVGP